ncbi:hypothetical protein [Halosolutus gelatinilyticus]|uniref:hypothetical protein n=1 Tax=Halosolutus gelatinilyticus TaxID=2931975 RepID=UPI001FF2D9AD|nr:hypothetical protein [Halosolutus gelatinilyticus]
MILDAMHACCGAERFPPSDRVEDCEICGSDHRGEYNCSPPAHREPCPGADRQ